MWRLVREGLRFYGPSVVSTWVFNAAGALVAFSVLAAAGVVDFRRALEWTVQAAPVVVLGVSAVMSWVALGTEMAEHRIRLHLMLPMPLARLAGAQLLLPATILLAGLAVAQAVAALVGALHVAPAPWFSHAALLLFGVHALVGLMLTFAVREVVLLRETGLRQAALGGLGAVVLIALEILAIAMPEAGLALRAAAPAALAVLAALFAMTLFCRRTQFTR